MRRDREQFGAHHRARARRDLREEEPSPLCRAPQASSTARAALPLTPAPKTTPPPPPRARSLLVRACVSGGYGSTLNAGLAPHSRARPARLAERLRAGGSRPLRWHYFTVDEGRRASGPLGWKPGLPVALALGELAFARARRSTRTCGEGEWWQPDDGRCDTIVWAAVGPAARGVGAGGSFWVEVRGARRSVVAPISSSFETQRAPTSACLDGRGGMAMGVRFCDRRSVPGDKRVVQQSSASTKRTSSRASERRLVGWCVSTSLRVGLLRRLGLREGDAMTRPAGLFNGVRRFRGLPGARAVVFVRLALNVGARARRSLGGVRRAAGGGQ